MLTHDSLERQDKHNWLPWVGFTFWAALLPTYSEAQLARTESHTNECKSPQWANSILA